MVAAGKKRPCRQSLEAVRVQKEMGCTRGLSEMARGLCVALHHLDTVHLRIIYVLPSSHSLNKEET